MNNNYSVVLSEMRTSRKNGLRHAKVRAIANGIDSFKSIFTRSARERIITQLKSNGVKTNALHKNAIDDNLQIYLQEQLKTASKENKETLERLLGNLGNRDFPIGKVIDAKFVDDNVIEAEIVENDALKLLGKEQADYLDATWDMVEGGLLGGVSLVFNGVESFMSDDKLFINDVNVLGLDFVDRPSHSDTRVLETFTRAAQQSIQEGNIKMTNEEPIVKEPVPVKEGASFVDVDQVAAKVTATLEAKQKEKADNDALMSKEKEDLKSEYETKLQEANARAEKAEGVAKEAISIGEQLAKEKEDIVAKTDNPFAEQAKKLASEGKDPLEGLGFGELLALKDKI